MLVIDATSFIALVHNLADSAVLRAMDDLDGPFTFIFMAGETEREAREAYVADYGSRGLALMQQRIEETELTVLPINPGRNAEALAAFVRFGEGRMPATLLTLGDCAAYALAVRLRADLISETSELALIYRNATAEDRNGGSPIYPATTMTISGK